ncbi:MFS transporter [Nonomuraea sp. NPDC050556]|uniref:MFS transporter n=1 Tax=Nonomuraea sp. NPDC050556 TaxID=3364369 RepID=UPI003797EF86
MFRYLWASAAASNLADGVLKVGAPLLAVTLTRSPTLVSLVSVAVTLPWLLCTLYAGALADRLDRRRIMVIANWLRGGALALTAVASLLDFMSLPLLLVALLLFGVCEVFADTAAQAVLPMVVERERLAAANGRIVAAQTIGGDFLGGPLAGLLVAVLPTAVFGAPALLYSVAGALLLGMRGRRFRPEVVSTAPLRVDIKEGLSYLWNDRVVRALAIAAGMLNTANAAFFSVFVLWAVGPESRIGLTSSAFGVAMTVLAVGALLGSLFVARFAAWAGEGRTLVITWLGNSLLLLVPVVLPSAYALFPAVFLIGITAASSNVVVVSLRQRIIPSALLGRVNSAYRLIGAGGMPLGAAVGGLLAEVFGLVAVFYAAVAVCVLAVAVARAGLRTRAFEPALAA